MNSRQLSFIGLGLMVVGLLAWWLWPEKNVSFQPHAVPRAAVGPRTLAVARLDLAQFSSLDPAAVAGLKGSGAVDDAGTFEAVAQALSAEGVTQLVVPVSFQLGSGIGVYLGGNMTRSSEDMETSILQGKMSKAFKALTLMTAISPCGGGWRFWGVGDAAVASPDSGVAGRFENAFVDSAKDSSGAILQLVVLGSSLTGGPSEQPPPSPSDPRIVRQFRRLRQSAQGLETIRLAVFRDPANPKATVRRAGAYFVDDAAAARFVGSWRNIAGDLSAVMGPSGSPGLLDRMLTPFIDGLAGSVPRADGRKVTWGGAEVAAPARKS